MLTVHINMQLRAGMVDLLHHPSVQIHVDGLNANDCDDVYTPSEFQWPLLLLQPI